MGVKISRKKKHIFLLSFIYRAQKLLPLSSKAKLKLFLNLEWIFERLAHETSFKLYKRDEHPVRQQTKKFILDNISPDAVVLDLGCNTGDLSFFMAEKVKEVVGIDYDQKLIDIAQKENIKPNLTFYCREALEYLKENSKQFDVLILSHILEHLDDPKQFLTDFKKHFKFIYIELPDFDKSYLNQYRKNLNVPLIYSDDDHISEFDRFELAALLKDCNIKILKEEYRFGVQKLWCGVN